MTRLRNDLLNTERTPARDLQKRTLDDDTDDDDDDGPWYPWEDTETDDDD